MSSDREIVITGIGIMSPVGSAIDAAWESVSAGRNGFRKVQHLSFIGTPDCIGGEVEGFDEKSAKKTHLKQVRKQIKVMCREIQLGVASALQAVENSGLDMATIDNGRVGVDFGANLMSSPPDVLLDAGHNSCDEQHKFAYERWGLSGEDRFKGMEPLWLLKYLPNMPGCHIGIAVDARGPNNSLTQDEASGGLAIAEAANIIRRDRADVMITGTTGTRLHAVKACQHDKWDVLAAGPAETRCRPFDRSRNGEVMAESSCTLVLEAREHAEARGATIYGTILSTAASCVLSKDGSADEGNAVLQSANKALTKAGVGVNDLGHVSACASGHPRRDAYEAAALTQLVGSPGIPVTALKSYAGSAGSGSAIAELALSLMGARHGLIPRTLNFESADDGVDMNVVHGEHLATDNKLFLKTSVTRMGQASAVVVSA